MIFEIRAVFSTFEELDEPLSIATLVSHANSAAVETVSIVLSNLYFSLLIV